MTNKQQVFDQTAEFREEGGTARIVEKYSGMFMPWLEMGNLFTRVSEIVSVRPEARDVSTTLNSYPGTESIDCTHDNYRTDTSRDYTNTPGQARARRTTVIKVLYIGAARSGSAFCYQEDGQRLPIKMNHPWVTEFNINTSTVPTAILYDTAGNYEGFGHEAITTFKHAPDPEKHQLNTLAELTFREHELDHADPHINAFLAYVFEQLQKNIDKQLEQNNLRPDKNDIQWILTYSNILRNDLSQQFIEQVLGSSKIDFLPEDVAAALCCAETPIYELTERQHPSMNNGDRFVVLDSESGYISLFKKQDTMFVEKLDSQELQYNLLDNIEKYLCEVFEKQNILTIHEYKTTYPRDWFMFLKDIQTQLDGFSSRSKMPITVALPFTFNRFFKNIPSFSTCGVSLNKENKIIVEQDYIRQLVNMYTGRVFAVLNRLKNIAHNPISHLFLIGKAMLLKEPIENFKRGKTFSSVVIRKVHIPQDSGAAALNGAVMHGTMLA